MPHDLVTRACQTAVAYLAQGNERFEAEGAVFLRNRQTPRRHDVNCVCLARDIDHRSLPQLLDRVQAEYQGLGHRQFFTDPLTPPELQAQLTLESGYRVSEGLWLALEGEIDARPKPVEIRQVVDDADWLAYEELDRLWWLESGTAVFGPYDRGLHDELTLSKRLKAPAVRNWLAYQEGRPAAFLSSFAGENGVGMVEDLFAHPDSRHRGLATALIAHCVADARSRGAGPVIIAANPGDTPKRMYAMLGFRPLMVTRQYLRLIE